MFQDTIVHINNGATLAELSEALRNVVAAVKATGKNGSITLTLAVKPASKGVTDVVMVESQVKTKLPDPDRGISIFYVTDSNDLVRNDPKQMTLPALKVVEIEPNKDALKEVV